MSVSLAIAMISLFAMFPVLRQLRRTGAPGVGDITTACLLAALSCAVSAMFSPLVPTAGAVAGAMLSISAALVALSGIAVFTGRPPLARHTVAAVIVASAAVLALAAFTGLHPHAAAGLEAGMSGMLLAATAALLLRRWRKDRTVAPYRLFCGALALALGLVGALQFAANVAGAPNPASALGWPQVDQAVATVRLLGLPLLFLGIILMLHGWLIASLKHMVAHDDLTCALSRRVFMRRCERMFQACASTGSPLAFMLLDLDRFKRINDHYGHAGGDAALGQFTAIVHRCLADRGVVGRLGGEEFGVALAGIGRKEAAAIAETICAAVRGAPVRSVSGADIALTVSIGLAMAEPGFTLSEVMVRADMALYEAKAAGRDRLCVAGSLQTATTASARALAGAAAQLRAASLAAEPAKTTLTGTG